MTVDAAAYSGGSVGQCSTTGRVDAHRLNPPRFCNAFDHSHECIRHFTPRGLCEWEPDAHRCSTSPSCAKRTRAPTGTSYLFFKFHKVGSSTVSGTLRLALMASSGDVYSACMRASKLRNKTAVERARYAHCSLCAKHDNSLPLLPFFRRHDILGAPPSRRLALLFGAPDAAAVLDENCPQRASLHNHLRTGIVFRRPVDRVISKYYFLRTYCQSKAQRLGRASCVALDLDLLPWVYSIVQAHGRSVVGAADWHATHEVRVWHIAKIVRR
jgi:hypothetical protein